MHLRNVFSRHSRRVHPSGQSPEGVSGANNSERHSQQPTSPNTAPPSRQETAGGRRGEMATSAFKTALGIVKECANGTPLQAAIGGLIAVLDVIEMTQSNAQALTELGSQLMEMKNSVLVPLTQLDRMRSTEEFDIRAKRLGERIEDVSRDLDALVGQGAARRVLNHRINASEIGRLGGRIKEAVDAFMFGGFIAQESRARQRRCLDLIDRLPHAPARYNSAPRSFAPTCLERTRTALLDNIDCWINEDNLSPPIFWLGGLAGTGKSTIAQTVAERCDARAMLGASFFFARQDASRCDPLTVFTTIAHQLAMFRPSFRLAIARAVETHDYPADVAVEVQLRDFIIGPLCEVAAAAAADQDGSASLSSSVVAIVIDGLDECDDRQRATSHLLRQLGAQISKIPFPLKFFITSRPEPPIVAEFSSTVLQSLTRSFLLHQVEPSVVQADVTVFLHHHLSRLGGPAQSVGWPSEVQLTQLVGKAAGLFIFAKTSVDFISRYGPEEAQEQLDVLLNLKEQEGEGYGVSPYRTLDALYLQVLQKAIPEEDEEHAALVMLFQPVVGTLALTFDPPSTSVLERLAGVPSGRAKRILRRLSSVITIPSAAEDVIQAWHQSFPDFLTDQRRCRDDRFFIDPGLHHRRLALMCLERMAASLKRNICHLGDSSLWKLNSELEDLQARIDRFLSKELQYCCRHWASHLLRSLPAENILERLEAFSFKHLLHWLEALSFLGQLNLAIPALRDARQWCENNKANDTLIALLDDGERFVLMFFEPISLSAQHVYHSALPFTPQNTILSLTYASELASTIRVHGCVEDVWDPCMQVFMLPGRSHIQCLALSSDGYLLVVAANSKTLQVLHSVTGACIRTLEGHTSDATCVAFSPDDDAFVVSGSNDTTLRIWDTASGISLLTLRGHTRPITSVAYSPQGSRLVSQAADDTVRIWDSSSGAPLRELDVSEVNPNYDAFKGIYWPRSNTQFSPDGTMFAAIDGDYCIRFWSTETGELLSDPPEGRGQPVFNFAFSPKGKCLAIAFKRSPEVKMLDHDTRTTLGSFYMADTSYSVMSFSPQGHRLAVGSVTHVYIWDVFSATLLARFPGYSYAFLSLSFFPDGRRVLSGSYHGMLRIWDSETQMPSSLLKVRRSPVSTVTFFANGRRLLSVGTFDVCIWDTSTGTLLVTRPDQVTFATISPSGDCILSVEGSFGSIWNSVNGRLLGSFEVETKALLDHSNLGNHTRNDEPRSRTYYAPEITHAAFSPDGLKVATFVAFSQQNVYPKKTTYEMGLWHVGSGTIFARTDVNFAIDRTGLTFPRDNAVLFRSQSGSTWVWDVECASVSEVGMDSPSLTHEPGHQQNAFERADFSQEGGWIVASSGSRSVKICWLPVDYRSRRDARSVQGHTFVSGSESGKVIFVDLKNCKLEEVFGP